MTVDRKAGRSSGSITWWRRIFAGAGPRLWQPEIYLRLDIRSLAAFRIAIACLLLADQFVAFTNLEAFYTDDGVLPRRLLFEKTASSAVRWSLYFAPNSAFLTGVLLAFAALVALGLLFGYRTWLMTLLSWVMLCSLQVRNLAILHGGHQALRTFLFWSLFLPLGSCWSIDAVRAKAQGVKLPSQPMRTASVAIMLQLAYIYCFGAELKSDPAWHQQGTAVYMALSLDQFATRLGVWMAQQIELCRIFTHATWWLEAVGPLLLFIPFWTSTCRLLAVVLFMGLHIGLGMTLELGPFSWVMCAAWLPVLPRELWDWFDARWRVAARIDRLLETNWLQSVFAFADKLVPPGFRTSNVPEAPQSLANGRKPQVRAKERWQIAGGDSRYWKGSLNRWQGRATAAFCAFCVGYITLANMRALTPPHRPRWLPSQWRWIGHGLWLEQSWRLFAPRPRLEDGWPVLAARLANGREVDLFRNGAPVDFRKPYPVSAIFKDSRWRKLLLALYRSNYTYEGPYVAAYFCKKWNESHPKAEQVGSYNLWFMVEKTPPPGEPLPPLRKVQLLKDVRL